MKITNSIAAFIAIAAALAFNSCSNNNHKPDIIKINAELPVELFIAAEMDDSVIALLPALMRENVHISELIHYQGDSVITVPFCFSDTGKYAQITEANLEKRIAISINGDIVSTPIVKMKITNGACSVHLSKNQIAKLFPSTATDNF